ncbi:MAG: hypothetical protein MZV64_59960 [Ignavibacteriales bacterium]|nr:hypothetical protein [Ignavibacteriales bacterium]
MSQAEEDQQQSRNQKHRKSHQVVDVVQCFAAGVYLLPEIPAQVGGEQAGEQKEQIVEREHVAFSF